MDTKLTLKLDKEIIELAKVYVKEQGTSLSKFIEDYLRRLVKPKAYVEHEELHPIVREMLASFDNEGAVDLPDDFDFKKAKGEYLFKKYGK
jgi:hypothetical protein